MINPGDDFIKDKKEKKDKQKNKTQPENIKSKPNSKYEDNKTKNNNLGGLRIRKGFRWWRIKSWILRWKINYLY